MLEQIVTFHNGKAPVQAHGEDTISKGFINNKSTNLSIIKSNWRITWSRKTAAFIPPSYNDYPDKHINQISIECIDK